jgi:hypothetical protein
VVDRRGSRRALVALLLTACGGTPRPGADSAAAPTTEASATNATGTTSADRPAFRVIIGDTVLTGHLFDNPPETLRRSCR